MKIYAVGGQVRDELIGRTVHDKDYVVVGSTHDEMINAGFTQVGSEFPVYLHPETKEEYALARKERKSGEGHKGFEVSFSSDVSLEEDLSRRDLTVNSIAKDLESGFYIDPFNGIGDIKNKVLKHTTEAFADDPLRVLRTLRLKAQLGSGWTIHHKTYLLLREISASLDELPAERKWKEMEKALHSDNFKDYVYGLDYVNQLPELRELEFVEQPAEHHPEGNAYTHTMLCLDVADTQSDPIVKFAVLCHDFGKAVTLKEYGNLLGHEAAGIPVVEKFCNRMKVPNNYKKLALKVTEYHTKVHSVFGRGESKATKPKSIMKLFEQLGVVGKSGEEFLVQVLDACACDARGRAGMENMDYPQKEYLLTLWRNMVNVNTKEISLPLLSEGKSGTMIGEAIRVARIDAIRQAMRKYKQEETK